MLRNYFPIVYATLYNYCFLYVIIGMAVFANVFVVCVNLSSLIRPGQNTVLNLSDLKCFYRLEDFSFN